MVNLGTCAVKTDILYFKRQVIEINKLKRELEMLRESIKLYERNTLKKDKTIDNLSKAFEKQCEKNQIYRVMMEWKIKSIENNREVIF